MKQYAASPIIQKLASYRDGYFAPDWQQQFYDVVWNVDTAEGFGLDIWGRIVVVGRDLQIPSVNFFGFNTSPDQSWSPFNVDAFYNGPASTQTFRLEDKAYRSVILAKAMTNISATDCRSLNRVLQQLYPDRGRAWVDDLGDMKIRLVFEFALEPWERAILESGEYFPRPAGVGIEVSILPSDTFGFYEAGDAQPFDQGTFQPNGVA